MISKKACIAALVAQLQTELAALMVAAKAAREAATHEESKPEDMYDTRGLEASYLAGAQAARVDQLQAQIVAFSQVQVRDAVAGEAIAPGSLVELEDSRGKRVWYFVVNVGGGISAKVDGVSVQVITPQSPLGDALVGRRAGEPVEVEVQDTVREYRVVSVG